MTAMERTRAIAELADRIGPRGDRRYIPARFDVRRDAPLDPPWKEAPADAVLLFDGLFLHRPELVPHWDWTVFVQVGFEIATTRALERDRALFATVQEARAVHEQRYIAAQRTYLADHRPRQRADIVFINDDPGDPAVVLNRSARWAVKPPEPIRDLYRAFTNGHRRVLGEKLFAAYLFGAIAFPETRATGDIDFHVILTEALSEGERQGLDDLHAALGRDFPPLGVDMDGYYILLEGARREVPPPKSDVGPGHR